MLTRRRDFHSLIVTWGLTLTLCAAVNAAAPNVPEQHTRQPVAQIPFTPAPGSRARDVELYVSTDSGRAWTFVTQMALTGRRETNKFNYTMPSDGTYWFAARSIDQNSVATPATLDQLQAGLIVHLDRRPPIIQLRAVNKGQNVVGVEWDVRDEHFDPSRFVIEYRVPGQSDWVMQPADAKTSGTQFWELTTAPKIEVRMRVSDRAGNEADASIVLQPGGGGSAASSSPNEPNGNNQTTNPNPNPQNNRPAIHYLNSREIVIPFRISNVGVSGVPVVDLWHTRDMGRTWQKVPRSNDEAGALPKEPGDGEAIAKQFAFNAPNEGLYGFTIVVRSGVGIGDADPVPGEAPKRLVEVDITKPEVTMSVTRGSGSDVRNVTIEWSCRDKNLAERPVSLHHSATKEGPWETIIADLDAKGRYVWSVSDQGPFQFYVQVRATDKAGNVGVASGQDRITVDLSRPRAVLDDPLPLKK